MKFNVFVHLLSQVLAQGAVAALFTGSAEKWFAAAVAVVGVVAAWYDVAHGDKLAGR